MAERRILLLVGGIAAAVVLVFSGVIFAQTGSGNGMHRIRGPFAMTEMTGHPVTDADLKGKPTAMFFGFTRCPAVCPVTLQTLTNVLGRMGANADRINVVFVTVDPERDTPQSMRDYLGSFDPRIRGFIGTQAQLVSMADAYRVQFRRVPLDGGDYTMDHTAAVMLFDERGSFSGMFTSDDSETVIRDKLESLVRSASPSVASTAGPKG